jgi:hypothetical protein
MPATNLMIPADSLDVTCNWYSGVPGIGVAAGSPSVPHPNDGAGVGVAVPHGGENAGPHTGSGVAVSHGGEIGCAHTGVSVAVSHGGDCGKHDGGSGVGVGHGGLVPIGGESAVLHGSAEHGGLAGCVGGDNGLHDGPAEAQSTPTDARKPSVNTSTPVSPGKFRADAYIRSCVLASPCCVAASTGSTKPKRASKCTIVPSGTLRPNASVMRTPTVEASTPSHWMTTGSGVSWMLAGVRPGCPRPSGGPFFDATSVASSMSCVAVTAAITSPIAHLVALMRTPVA